MSAHLLSLCENTHVESESRSVVSDSVTINSPWNSPGQKTGVGSLSLLQGICPTQGSNPGLPHCKWILYQLSHKGSPRIWSGSLNHLQRVFPTQESKWGLLLCRRILYQLNYQKEKYYYTFQGTIGIKMFIFCV